MRPMEGMRVLDLSRMVAGGVAGMLLADFGADVVKVEQPGAGDPLRQWTTAGRTALVEGVRPQQAVHHAEPSGARRTSAAAANCCRGSTCCSSRSFPARSITGGWARTSCARSIPA